MSPTAMKDRPGSLSVSLVCAQTLTQDIWKQMKDLSDSVSEANWILYVELLYETEMDSSTQASLYFLGGEIKPPSPPKFVWKPERGKIKHQQLSSSITKYFPSRD